MCVVCGVSSLQRLVCACMRAGARVYNTLKLAHIQPLLRIPDYWSVITLTRHVATMIASFLCLYPYFHVSVSVHVGIRVGMNLSVIMTATMLFGHAWLTPLLYFKELRIFILLHSYPFIHARSITPSSFWGYLCWW